MFQPLQLKPIPICYRFKSLSSNGNMASIRKCELWKISSMNIRDKNRWKYITVFRSNILRGSNTIATVKILVNDNRWCRSKREIKSNIAMTKAKFKRRRLSAPKIGLKFKEEISKVPNLAHSLVWYWKFDTSKSISEIPRRFWNVVLEKDEEDQLDRLCEKWRSSTDSQGEGE